MGGFLYLRFCQIATFQLEQDCSRCHYCSVHGYIMLIKAVQHVFEQEQQFIKQLEFGLREQSPAKAYAFDALDAQLPLVRGGRV